MKFYRKVFPRNFRQNFNQLIFDLNEFLTLNRDARKRPQVLKLRKNYQFKSTYTQHQLIHSYWKGLKPQFLLVEGFSRTDQKNRAH